MQSPQSVSSIVLSSHALARIAATEAGNEAPSAQWRALAALEREGALRLGALARAARSTQPGMTRLVRELEHQGHARRSADPDDSRVSVVTATAAGLAALDDWRTQLGDTLAPRFADLADEDWLVLERAAQLLASRTGEGSRDATRTAQDTVMTDDDTIETGESE